VSAERQSRVHESKQTAEVMALAESGAMSGSKTTRPTAETVGLKERSGRPRAQGAGERPRGTKAWASEAKDG
jgi:hypothetical protein